jgi:cobalt-zinc-cadmium efflux system protein
VGGVGGHAPPDAEGAAKVLRRCLVLTLGFSAVEAATGWLTGSLALLGDAGHMAADAAGLGLAVVAARLSERRPSRRFTYGLGRVEVIAAVLNGLTLVGVVAWIAVEALARIREPRPVEAGPALLVAALGCAVNLWTAALLRRGEPTLNVRAAFLHVLGDLLGSLAALVSGTVILLTGWLRIDPILSLFISALVLVAAIRVLRDGARILLEGVPAHLSVEEIGRAMAGVEGVLSVHDLHVWQLSSREVALSAHLVLKDLAAWESVVEKARLVALERFGITHVTLQPEPAPAPVRIEGA